MHNKLRELRLKNDYSSRYMAERLNISKPFYSQLENDRRKLNYDMAIKIAKVFNTKPDKIFYEEHVNRECNQLSE